MCWQITESIYNANPIYSKRQKTDEENKGSTRSEEMFYRLGFPTLIAWPWDSPSST
jgi:hypothetical protein